MIRRVIWIQEKTPSLHPEWSQLKAKKNKYYYEHQIYKKTKTFSYPECHRKSSFHFKQIKEPKQNKMVI